MCRLKRPKSIGSMIDVSIVYRLSHFIDNFQFWGGGGGGGGRMLQRIGSTRRGGPTR